MNVGHLKLLVFAVLFGVIFHTSGQVSEGQFPEIKCRSFNYPVLKNRKNNPVCRIAVKAGEKPGTILSFKIKAGKAELDDLKAIRIFYTGTDSVYNTNHCFGEARPHKSKISVSGVQRIEGGTVFFWISFELRKSCKLTAKLNARPYAVQIDSSWYNLTSSHSFPFHRVGIAVRKAGDDGVNTFRIPGLVTTGKGTLLASYDVRYDSARDLQGDIDIGISRSTDGGDNWEPMCIVLDLGKWGGLPEKFNGISDACILADTIRDQVFVAGLWMHGVLSSESGTWIEGLNETSTVWNHQWNNNGSLPGLGVTQTSQFLITRSLDDGVSWTPPVNLTNSCKNPGWHLFAPCPGRGIVTSDGCLVLPVEGKDEFGHWFSSLMYSGDGGKSWITGTPACPERSTNECQIAEIPQNGLMLNMRGRANEKEETNGRTIALTYDLGKSWVKHPTSNGTLAEPGCMASLYRFKHLLFFSNPNSNVERRSMTIKISSDYGNSWPEKYQIELDEGIGNGYSCLTSVDDLYIGILYESSQEQLVFQKIPISDFFSAD